MKEILIKSPKYGSHVIVIDDDDYDKVKNLKWCIKFSCGAYYARAWQYFDGGRTQVVLHRMISGAIKNDKVYFVDGDWKNCRKENIQLRMAAVYVDMGDYYKIVIHSIKHGVQEIMFDKDDYELVSRRYWGVCKTKGKPIYAQTSICGKTIKMHSLLTGIKNVDHANNNGIDNRRFNLRTSTASQNNLNIKIKSNNTTGFKGVFFVKSRNKYWAYISANGKRFGGGYFKKAEDAAKKYNELALLHHGAFASLNEVSCR